MGYEDFFIRLAYPSGLVDLLKLWFVASLAVLSFVLGFSLIPKKWASVLKTLVVVALCAIGYGAVIWKAVPHFSRFADGKIGVLLLNSNDSAIKERLGGRHLNDLLKFELEVKLLEFSQKMKIPALDSIVQFKSVSWIAESESEARGYMASYNASSVLWGQLVNQNDIAVFTGFNLNRPLVMGLDLPGIGKQGVAIEQRTGPLFKLDFSGKTPAVTLIAKELVDGLLPVIAGSVAESRPLLAAELIRRIPFADPWYQDSCCYMGVMWMSAADIYSNADSINLAGISYDSSYACLMRLQDPNKGPKDKGPYSPLMVSRMIAYVKHREGLLAYRSNRKSLAQQCFKIALREADSAMAGALMKELSQRGIEMDTSAASTSP